MARNRGRAGQPEHVLRRRRDRSHQRGPTARCAAAIKAHHAVIILEPFNTVGDRARRSAAASRSAPRCRVHAQDVQPGRRVRSRTPSGPRFGATLPSTRMPRPLLTRSASGARLTAMVVTSRSVGAEASSSLGRAREAFSPRRGAGPAGISLTLTTILMEPAASANLARRIRHSPEQRSRCASTRRRPAAASPSAEP